MERKSLVSKSLVSNYLVSNYLVSKAFIVTGEGDPPTDPPTDPPKVPVKTFTQDEVNTLVKETKRKANTATQVAIDELNAIKAQSNLTTEEKTDLENRIKHLQTQIETKEETAKRELERSTRESEEAKSKAETEAEGWKNRFSESTILRSITDGAVTYNALVPEQLVAILKPDTFLHTELDADTGEATGRLIPMVKQVIVDDTGKSKTLELTVPDAIKNMREMNKYYNLFKSDSTGGLNLNNRPGGGGTLNIQDVAKDPKKYRELRKSGKIE